MKPEELDPPPAGRPVGATSADTTTAADSREPVIEKRPLGALGENVSAMGLGCGPLARLGDHADWDGTLRAAVDAGVTVIDAAPRLRRQHSETMLGRVLADGLGAHRDELFLSTRCTPLDGKPFDTSEDAVRAQLEASLERLQTDRIDLYQVHDVETANPKKLLETTLPVLVAARERGDVRYIGASGGSLELLREVVIAFPVDAVLSYARYDLTSDELKQVLLDDAEERGVAVLNASPLHMGLLANPQHAREIAAADRATGEAASRAFTIAERAGVTLPRLALEFASEEPRIACTLVGCANIDELRANVASFGAAPTELEARCIADIRAAFREALG
ncbi:MAG: aldo/keto reductase [Planctomycetota bacterium]